MRSAWLGVTMCLFAPLAHPIETFLWRDLAISAEKIPGQTRINGVPLQVVRFTGRDVDTLEQRWKDSRGVRGVRSNTEHGWRVHSSIHDRQSEVVQARTLGDVRELIWSSIPILPSPPPVPESVIGLPAVCKAGNVVEGRDAGLTYLQVSSTCNGNRERVLGLFEDLARRQGLRILRRDAAGMQVGARQSTITISLLPSIPGAGSGRIDLVLLELTAAKARK